MDYLLEPLFEIKEYCEILDSLKSYAGPLSIIGPSESQKVHISTALCGHLGMRGLYITYSEIEARKAFFDMTFFLGDDVLLFPSKEIMLYDVEAKSNDAVFQRIRTLCRILEGKYKFLIASAEAVSHMLIPRKNFESAILDLKVGSRSEPRDISKKLVEMGYEKVYAVEGPGQFAARGGIMDVFSVNNDHAVRIEFFDDIIDSIRTVDTASQRSMEKLDSVRIIPAREIIYPAGKLDVIASRIEKDLALHIEKIGKTVDARYINHIKERISHDIERIKNDRYFPGIDRYISYLVDDGRDITDYIPEDTVIFIDEPLRIKQRIDTLIYEHHETCKNLTEKGYILPNSQNVVFDWESLGKSFEKRKIACLKALAARDEIIQAKKSISIASRQTGPYHGHIDLLADDILNWKSGRGRVVVLVDTKGRGERLSSTLRSMGIEAVYKDAQAVPLKPGEVVITCGGLARGFEYPSIGLAVISHGELFGRGGKRKKAPARKKESRINVFADLNIGDYVVHDIHGIGEYKGIDKLVIDGIARDYLKIRYLDGDFLYIPTNQMDLVQKYIGTEGKAPRLSKLGGADWVKTKKKVKESLKEIAGELIRLYAQRESMKGFAFSKDTVWQAQFEELFPYEETEDQLKCINEVKRDMESDRPMDRLLCGDVGYGKTEVALRALFKAVMDGKQVAYLVPTTVLAQQHYINFKERLKDFPVTVEVLSRFRTAAEQKKILKDLKAGNIDILIGTHRLLQKDIQFKDLGLLVVDEEQRFGVGHKERIKSLKPNIDVLTLTATPIPRTLHMSLVGIRDISIIEDPPEDRHAVQTYVMEYNADVVENAIIRELARKGQVFYLFNNVRSIERKAAEIREMVPGAKIAVAHGQMEEKRLEDVMIRFINGEYDVLVCTTIIESGLDMPNVNTIIVEDADKMGLSQLYQLRGRVGRSNRLAYAYITYRKNKVLSEVAEKRLRAIKEFTELGSGFKIAMRDLEIRGAGNILGPEQHGHMESVGYDMYIKLLEQAVRELKGEPDRKHETGVSHEFDVNIDLKVSAYIDSEYIGAESQKIEMYKKIAAIRDEEDAVDIENELADRFGDLPQPVKNLISIAYIKALARHAGFSSITEKGDYVCFYLADGRQVDIKALSKLMAKYKRQLLFNAGTTPYLLYKIKGLKREELLENIKIVLQDVKSFEHN